MNGNLLVTTVLHLGICAENQEVILDGTLYDTLFIIVLLLF